MISMKFANWFFVSSVLLLGCGETNNTGPGDASNGFFSGTGGQGGSGLISGGSGAATGNSGTGAVITVLTGGFDGSDGHVVSDATFFDASSDGTTSDSGGGDDASTNDPPAECGNTNAQGHFQLENLDRGLIAVQTDNGNYVGWRMLGYEYDAEQPERVAYNLYRDDTLLATVKDSTNYFDSGAPASAAYRVSAVIDAVECAQSEPVTPWEQPYLTISLDPPPGGTTPDGVSYAYNVGRVRESRGSVNDGSPGDVDGDGQFELVVIWEPSNAQDNSNSGYTGPVYMDCYELDGTRLWRLDLGQNIRAGAHYTQFVVYDFDGNGRSEIAVRTAPGTRDANGTFLSQGPAADDDDNADYRNRDGRVLSGPEYLTIFEGATGLELTTVAFEVARGRVEDWGDDYGNRVDRFLASAAFVSDLDGSGEGSGRPAILMARGYYARSTVTAWSYRDNALRRLWTADSSQSGSGALYGQGAHSMAVADVDGDNAQEIIYGAAMIQSDGSFGCATGFGHGDALHVGDLIPSRAGLEVFMPHEDKSQPIWDIRDAQNCEVIHVSSTTGSDNGRGVAADIIASNPGAEMWSSADADLRSCTTDQRVGSKPSSTNFLIYWDADELRELEDRTSITKGDGTRLLTCDACMSNNHTKATPTLTADLFGDWREEIIWRTPDSSALRVYTTTDVTQRRIYTLMHDPQYRMQVSSEQTAYNQPPHPGFLIGADMLDPPAPDLHVR